tara:strand:- start:250 stop:708 length:459 start_codon:yes stop_codon:yes gene_type:complete
MMAPPQPPSQPQSPHQQRRLLFDTGASKHTESDLSKLTSIVRIHQSSFENATITGVGGKAQIVAIGSWANTIDGVLHIPSMNVALFSPPKFIERYGGTFIIGRDTVHYLNKTTKHHNAIFAQSDGQRLVVIEPTMIAIANSLQQQPTAPTQQ